jgi:hypothetical protein
MVLHLAEHLDVPRPPVNVLDSVCIRTDSRRVGTTTVFGTPVDVTVAEIALECFFPADAVTADYLQERQRSPA